MHAIEIIVIRNAQAAGREAAQAVNDGRDSEAADILASTAPLSLATGREYSNGYFRERRDETASYGLGARRLA